jgi:ribosomal subunit interface protein
MKKKISFIHMDHSDAIEQHIHKKLEKIEHLLHKEKDSESTPFFCEITLKAQRQHPHHQAEFHLKTPWLNLHSHDEGTDMYIVIDSMIDKMATLIKKEKEKKQDARTRVNKHDHLEETEEEAE